MMRTLTILACVPLAMAAAPHYSMPPCNSDEVELQVKDYETNYTGQVCAPACGDNDSCPTDKPPSVATPKCILHDSGKKYCGLKCGAFCGNSHMTCLRMDKLTRVCAYRNKPKPSPPKGKPCCQGHCADPNKAKYYSIAKSLWGTKHCGECCMEPKKYDLFHHFEANLTKADNDSPCKAFGYTAYDSTDTHGFGPISMTLDLYNLPKEAIEQAAAIPPHYAAPPCNSDETELQVTDYKTNYTGKVCAPACGDNGSCPTDKPPSSTTPQCLIHESGKKYCALGCFVGCGNSKMVCLRQGASGGFRRVCAYKTKKDSSIVI